ncbi:MAG TPA: DUF4337 domain-containing protein [Bryobacteraceae bacterium]|nr:DUF4337 domain-containing protein [Bryobacteraceae bacterium]
MSAEEELQEHSKEAREPFDRRVAATMAILAAALAVVSVLGHIATTEELLNQQRASDQWAFYQAKSIRRYQSEVARDLFASMKMDAQSRQYQQNADQYRGDTAEIQKEAQGLEQESHLAGRKALGFHFGEVFLEFSIVLASLAILSKRAFLWFASIASGTLGAIVAAGVYGFPGLIEKLGWN